MKNALMNAASVLLVSTTIGGAAIAAEGEYYKGIQPTLALFPVDEVVTGGPDWGKPQMTRKPTSRDNRQQHDEIQEAR